MTGKTHSKDMITVLILLVSIPLAMGTVFWRYHTDQSLADVRQACNRQFFSCASPARRNCHCDRQCYLYNDCCYDAPKYDATASTANDETGSFIDLSSCLPLTSDSQAKVSDGAFMVTGCPLTWTDNATKFKCEMDTIDDIFDVIPVTNMETNLTFRNKYCAKCNKFNDWMLWKVQLNCSGLLSVDRGTFDRLILLAFTSEICRKTFKPPDPDIIRQCDINIVYEIGLKGQQENYTFCNNTDLSPILVSTYKKDNVIFRNVECAKPWLENQTILAIHCYLMWAQIVSPSRNQFWTVGAMLDLSAFLYRQGADDGACPTTEVMLSARDGCHTLYCPLSTTPYHGECLEVVRNTNGLIMDMLFQINTTVDSDVHLHLMNEFATLINFFCGVPFIAVKHIVSRHSIARVSTGQHIETGRNCSLLYIAIPFQCENKRGQNARYDRFVTHLSGYHVVLDNDIFVQFVNDSGLSYCRSSNPVRNPTYVKELITSAYERDIPCPAVKIYRHLMTSHDTINMTSHDTINMTSYWYSIQTNITDHLRTRNIDERHVIQNGLEYFLCLVTYETMYKMNQSTVNIYSRNVRYILCMICSIISIISLLVLLFHYYIGVLEARKSVALILLFITLVFAQLLFLITSEVGSDIDTPICEWVGRVQHWVWLSTFTCMLLCLCRLYCDVTNISAENETKTISTVLRYISCGLLLPLVAVVTTGLCNMSMSPDKNWYGGHNCFIDNQYVLLFTFVLPAVLLIIANCVVFAIVVRYIQTTSMESSCSQSSGRKYVFVYLRLSTIIGFSWLLGVLGGFIEEEVLTWIFEVTTNLQGLFIALGFLCNQRTLQAWKRKLFKTKNSVPTAELPGVA